MSDFVEECRREWRRLGVPDPVANEMAADLTVDLEEAEAEGGSPEDVLGNSAFDPRRFAAAWAAARGVTSAPAPTVRLPGGHPLRLPCRSSSACSPSVPAWLLRSVAAVAPLRSPPSGSSRCPGRSGSSHRARGGS